jgi:DNA-binding MarR family transcriptional regulator
MAGSRGRKDVDVQIHELIAYRLNALINTILRSGSRQYAKAAKISSPEAWVLGAIGNFQPITAREVAARMAIDEAQVSRAIKALLARGLVSRRAAVNDNRRKILTLTAAGQRACERVLSLAESRQDKLLDGFSAADVERLTDMLIKLSDNAQRVLDDA